MNVDDRIGAYRVVARVDEDADPLLVVRWEEAPSAPLSCLRRLDPREAAHARALIGQVGQRNESAPFVPSTVVEQAGLVFVVSGFTPHVSLRRLLEGCFDKRKRLSPQVAAHIISRASSTLSSLGVVHGALDLARIGIEPRAGDVLVLGLGASHAQLDDRAMPDTRRIGYAAPEVMSVADADGRADVFSLGVVLWEMLTLRRLFPASSEADARARMQGSVIPPPTTLAREVPEALEAVVMRALSVDKSARFESVAAFAKALDAVSQPVMPALLVRLGRALVDPAAFLPAVAEYAKAWRGIEADDALLEMLTASLPTFFPKSFGDEPMRPKRVTNMPPRTQTLIGVTSPLAQNNVRAATSGAPAPSGAMGRVPVYQPKASTLVGMVAPQKANAPRATYSEASVPTNVTAPPTSPNRRAVPTTQSPPKRDPKMKSNRPKSMPPPLPPEVTRWPSSAPKPAPVPVEVRAPAPAPAPQKGTEGEWDDEDTTFYSRQEGWDDEPKTEVTDLPPVDQLPTTTIPQRAMGAQPSSSAGQVAAATIEPKVEAASQKPTAAAAPKPAQASMRTLQARLPDKPATQPKNVSATTSGITTTGSASATTSGITTSAAKSKVSATEPAKVAATEPAKVAATEPAKVPVPEAKPIRAPIGAPPKRVAPSAVPARVVRVGTPTATPAPSDAAPASATGSVPPPAGEHHHKITSRGLAPVSSSASTPPASPDPSWSALLESSTVTPLPETAPPAGSPSSPPGQGAAAFVVPPPAQFVVAAAAGPRASPDAPTLSQPIDTAAHMGGANVYSEPPPPPTNRGMQLVVATLVLGAIAAVAFLMGRVTAPTVAHPHVTAPAAIATPRVVPPPVVPAPVPPVVADPPAPAPVMPDAAVVATPTPVPEPVVAAPPPPEPAPPPPAPVATTAPQPTTTMRTTTTRMVTMATAPAMTTAMRPVIRAPDF